MGSAVALLFDDVKSLALAALLLLACDQQGGGTGSGSGVAARQSESGTRRGSAGGFSSTLSAELTKQGVEPAAVAGAPAPKPAPAAGSAAGSAAPTTTAPTPAVGSAAPTAAANDKPATAANDKPATTTTEPAGKAPAPVSDSRIPVKPPADIAAIKFDLEPNWDRDLGEAGTFSLLVKVNPAGDTRVFSFRYGYEDQAAPVDCDSYRKFLEEKKTMTVTLNRQRGAACYIEGNQGGAVVFRYLLTYGGKRLMCSGSLYKDPASTALGDLRDKVLMQAKKICETLAL